ncbi:aminoglycoside phosphotransferase family protein [Lachnospiraceae bacterium OttesenSCG-928-D06]|nr:aminoglycoside phosphotransferase family protein [Lachnospiraceae bacterium OttesenSCG-928-D06]
MNGTCIKAEQFGNGHINDTYLIQILQADHNVKPYILQRINDNVFTNPKEVMENILAVTSYLRKKIVERGGNPDREAMSVIPTNNGDACFFDETGSCYRVYVFIENAISLDQVEKADDLYESGVAFGDFQYLLSDFPADTLHVTIPGFHDTKLRFARLIKAVEADLCNRAILVKKEIEFLIKREEVACVLGNMLEAKELQYKVTHNDTKLNNVMIDRISGKGLCVIDLDTIMPGLAVHDFGDAIRFGASTGAEDEVNLDKIHCDLSLFEAYTKGFIKGCNNSLTQNELAMLPTGAKVMTYETGMRFLTDYLEGDTYFKIHREGHNLDRCRTQLKLIGDMELKWEQMHKIVERYA